MSNLNNAPVRSRLEEIAVRAPALPINALSAANALAPPGSALRRRVATSVIARIFAAVARGDVDVVQLVYEPDAEIWMSGLEGVGLGGCYRGRAGLQAIFSDLDEAWGEWRWIIRSMVDGGDRLALKADFVAHGRSSGVEATVINGGTAIRLSARARVEWQAWFYDADGWQKALEAAGLSE